MNLILRVLATALAAAVAALLIPGIVVSGSTLAAKAATLIVVAVIFGLVNAVVKPVAEALSGCLIVVTLGLFVWVLNALMLLLTSWLCGQLGAGFQVTGFVPALFGSVVISLVSWFLNGAFGTRPRSHSRSRGRRR